MIKKEEHVIRVDKLKALLLMEVDFSSLDKLIFSSKMTSSAKLKKRIPEELFGGPENLFAVQVVINRRSVIDTFRQKQHRGVITAVDSTQCYDRIVHSLSILLYQKEGAPLS